MKNLTVSLPEETLTNSGEVVETNPVQRLQAYWLLEDVACRAFLELGTNPADFVAVRLIFPFVRETTVCQTPRLWERLPDFLFFAFFSGHELGCRHPELREQFIPEIEVKPALDRLGILHKLSESDSVTRAGLGQAFEAVVEAALRDNPQGDVKLLVAQLTLKSARAGFAAATFAQADPVHSEFISGISSSIRTQLGGVLWRALIAAPSRAIEDALPDHGWHPLLRLARELYPDHSLEGKQVLNFLAQRLDDLAITLETDCPTDDLDLIDWVTEGLAYGRRFKLEHPEIVAAILQECAGKRLDDSRSVVRRVVAEAGRVEPLALIRPLKRWAKQVHDSSTSEFYGNNLAPVAYFADFAIWIGWLEDELDLGKDKPN